MHGRYAKKLEQPWQCYYYTRIIFLKSDYTCTCWWWWCCFNEKIANELGCVYYILYIVCSSTVCHVIIQEHFGFCHSSLATSNFVPPPLWINIMSHFDEPKMDKKYLKIVSKFSDYFTANTFF